MEGTIQMKGDQSMSKNTSHCKITDFHPTGEAIKAARNKRNLTRNQAAEIIGISTSHLNAIENRGRKPGYDVFIATMTILNISFDELYYPDSSAKKKATLIRQIIESLGELSDKELLMIKSFLDTYIESDVRRVE